MKIPYQPSFHPPKECCKYKNHIIVMSDKCIECWINKEVPQCDMFKPDIDEDLKL
jgi:hypothetical protein